MYMHDNPFYDELGSQGGNGEIESLYLERREPEKSSYDRGNQAATNDTRDEWDAEPHVQDE